MPKADFERLSKYALRKDDILVSVVGTLGNAAIIEEENTPAIFSCKSTVLRTHGISPQYLLAYLNSRYGRSLLLRKERGAVQKGLNLDDLKTLDIYDAGKALQVAVEQLYKKAVDIRKSSKSTYAKAEILLLDRLGMADFSPSLKSINIQTFENSFARTGRLDAEYYQPKYEQLVNKITSQAHARLIELVCIKKSIEPGSDAYSDNEESLPFLRVADYSKHGLTKPQKLLHSAFITEICDELDALKPKKNTILFSKDGSVGEAYCLREDGDFITSGAVLHLTVRNPNDILPEYLTLALNSKLVKMQSERDAGGSIILHWRVGEIENVVVPLVDMPTQEKIAAMIQESFSLKAESERLLDVAKRAVEIAIEQDENAASDWLNKMVFD